MKVSRAIAKALKQEGRGQTVRLPGQPGHRELRRRGHSSSHRAPGTDGPPYGGSRGSPEFRPQGGGLRHAARPGVENSFGGVAQAYSESVPLVVLPAGYGTCADEREPQLQLFGELPQRHEVNRTGDRSIRSP